MDYGRTLRNFGNNPSRIVVRKYDVTERDSSLWLGGGHKQCASIATHYPTTKAVEPREK